MSVTYSGNIASVQNIQLFHLVLQDNGSTIMDQVLDAGAPGNPVNIPNFTVGENDAIVWIMSYVAYPNDPNYSGESPTFMGNFTAATNPNPPPPPPPILPAPPIPTAAPTFTVVSFQAKPPAKKK